MVEAIRWHLELGGEVIAKIADAQAYEFPWTYGTLISSSEFDRFRIYFTDSNDWPDEDATIEALCGEVQAKGGFILHDLVTGNSYADMKLNHVNESVWFRIG